MSDSASTDELTSTSRRQVLAAGAGLAVGSVAGIVGGTKWGEFQRSDVAEDRDVAHRAGIDWGQRAVIWSFSPQLGVAVLSFDDGPNPEFTPDILRILDEFQCSATFFMLGRQVDEHPDLAREVVAAGHEVANHTWDHPTMSDLSLDAASKQIVNTRRIIEDVCGVSTNLFRPPRGVLTGNTVLLCGESGHDIVMWSATREVPGEGSVEEVVDAVSDIWSAGRVLDLHDGLGRAQYQRGSGIKPLRARRQVEIEALPQMIADAQDKGLRVVSVGEAMRLATSAAL